MKTVSLFESNLLKIAYCVFGKYLLSAANLMSHDCSADWLDNRGDPRGEFLRVQCEFNKFDFDSATVAELGSDLAVRWSTLGRRAKPQSVPSFSI